MSKTVDEITGDIVRVALKWTGMRVSPMRCTIRKIVAEALAQQREADARLVDGYRKNYGGNWPALEAVAATIRAGGENK